MKRKIMNNKLTEEQIDYILSSKAVKRLIRFNAKELATFCPDTNESYEGSISLEDLEQEILLGLVSAIRNYKGSFCFSDFVSSPTSCKIFSFLFSSATKRRLHLTRYYLSHKRNLFTATEGTNYMVRFNNPVAGTILDYDRESGQSTFVTPELPSHRSNPVSMNFEVENLESCYSQEATALFGWISLNCRTTREGLNRFDSAQAAKDLGWTVRKVNEVTEIVQKIVQDLDQKD